MESSNCITILRTHADEIYAYARGALPEECCGLVGGRGQTSARVYPLRNAAANPRTSYEAHPEELFAAQKNMRRGGEKLLAIYHSHPRAEEPEPSATDVRLAYYPEVVYLIVGFRGRLPVLRGFRLYADERRWERIEFQVK